MQQLFKEYRFWFIVLFKVLVIAGSFLLAYLLRFDFSVPPSEWRSFLHWLPALLLIKLAVFWWQGTFRGWWRYVSIADVIILGRANAIASLSFFCYAAFVHRLVGIPRSVLVIDWILCFCVLAGVRLLTRALRENYLPILPVPYKDTVLTLVVGAGQAGQAIAREIRQNRELKHTVVGFVDDDPEKQGQRFNGIHVLGSQDQLEEVIGRTGVKELIIAIPSATGKQMRAIVDRCSALGVKFRTLPGIGDLIEGKVSVSQVRDVDLEDLLGRAPVRLEPQRIRAYLAGKSVLVTGAAGSIGSEICRQVARFQPARLILFDHAESPLFHIQNELGAAFPDLRLNAVVGDVRDRARVEGLFDEFMPQAVFHAAAYKHVPMMEHNPAEAVNNNVQGTRVVADAAHAGQVESFVMVSTDKAVNPTNVMGASKRVAELYVQGLSRRSSTRFVTVRFGNVLGSAGSVVPTFREQILKGGPVTVTHPEVTRFFMTIPEASQLVLQAGGMGQGGEIYLLDMGEPVKIAHLAEELIRLSGFIPGEDIEISYTGLRPGEKLYEELLIAGEGVKPTSHEKIMVAAAKAVEYEQIEAAMEELYQAQRCFDLPRVLALLRETVPEYCPEQAGGPRVNYTSAESASEASGQGAANVVPFPKKA